MENFIFCAVNRVKMMLVFQVRAVTDLQQKVTENDEEKQITSLVRNRNDHFSQRGNSMPFDNEYYFVISLAGDLRSPDRGVWQKLRFKILFLNIR